ncbi:MAG: aminopeptidase, partial [Stenotrophomonas sp.]|nr:aminopeptidase [Stenotrophomonas sp.]
MRSPFLLIPLAVALASGCSKEPAAPTVDPTANAPAGTAMKADSRSHDESSYAEPDKVVVKDLALDLKLDFDSKQIGGTATYTLEWKDKGARQLVLDTRELSVEKVEAIAADGKTAPLAFVLAPADKVFGSKLSIETPDQPAKVVITYHTAPTASGLQWLEPSMTEGKKLPFMFSQSQAIHARSWVPLQDTPSVRFTYSAHVVSRPDVMVLMSADNDPKAARDGDYTFKMPQPIPSYLLAIAAGDLVFEPISGRSGVWAEPTMVGKAAKEFED